MDHRLFDAACTGDITTLQFLLQEDPLLLNRLSLSSPENPLHVSAFSGQPLFAAEILRLKSDFAKEMNHQGLSPLHIASGTGHLEVVRELLRVGRDICLLKGKDGFIPLHFAAMKGRSHVMKEIIAFCPESLKEMTTSRETALHVAVKNNKVEAVRVLLEEIKASDMSDIVDWPNGEGNTVLHLATFAKQHEIIQMLIGEEAIIPGVKVDMVNSSGFTPKDILDLVLETEGGSLSEMYKLVQIFHKVKARKAREITIQPNSGTHQVVLSLAPSRFRNLWRMLDWEVKGSSIDTQNTLMVVAVLIATITYQGIVQPPGSFRSEDTGGSNTTTSVQTNNNALPGRAIMANDAEVFTFYAVFNAIGFLASMAMISLLTKGFPLRNWMRLCILSMMATYIIAIVYIAPKERYLVWSVLSVTGLIVLRELVLSFMWLFQQLKRIDQKSNRVH